MEIEYGIGWNKKISQYLIYYKYKIYGYIPLDKLSEWNRLIPKNKESKFICKKEYRYLLRPTRQLGTSMLHAWQFLQQRVSVEPPVRV